MRIEKDGDDVDKNVEQRENPRRKHLIPFLIEKTKGKSAKHTVNVGDTSSALHVRAFVISFLGEIIINQIRFFFLSFILSLFLGRCDTSQSLWLSIRLIISLHSHTVIRFHQKAMAKSEVEIELRFVLIFQFIVTGWEFGGNAK